MIYLIFTSKNTTVLVRYGVKVVVKLEEATVDEVYRESDEKNVVGSRSPFTRKGYNYKPSYGDLPMQDSDISFVSSGRPSIDRIFPTLYESQDMGGRATPPQISSSTDLDLTRSFESLQLGRMSVDMNFPSEFSSISQDSDRLSISSQSMVMF